MNGGHGEKYARWKVENEAEEVIWYTGQRDEKEKGEKEERGDWTEVAEAACGSLAKRVVGPGYKGARRALWGQRRGGLEGPGVLGAAIRVQLKCRASATQRQPPINKRDYRRTTRRISVQEDCSAANQPVRGAGCQPPPQNPLSRVSLTSSFFATFLRFAFPPVAFSFSPTSSRCLPPRCLLLSPPPSPPSLSPPPPPPPAVDVPLLLSRSLARSRTRAHTRVPRSRQTFCLLPLALTIKRWRRRACAAMFLIPLVPWSS